MKNTWKVLRSQEKANPEAYNKFVDEVIDFVASDKTSTKRTMSSRDELVEEGEWMSWHQAEQ